MSVISHLQGKNGEVWRGVEVAGDGLLIRRFKVRFLGDPPGHSKAYDENRKPFFVLEGQKTPIRPTGVGLALFLAMPCSTSVDHVRQIRANR